MEKGSNAIGIPTKGNGSSVSRALVNERHNQQHSSLSNEPPSPALEVSKESNIFIGDGLHQFLQNCIAGCSIGAILIWQSYNPWGR